MEYERIHKVQNGMISPSKLRMMLMGSKSNHQKKKDDGSDSNSSRTSPNSRLEDSEFVKNSLLSSENGVYGEQASSIEDPPNKSDSLNSDNASQNDSNSLQFKELVRTQLHSKGDGSNNSSSVHPVRSYEDENLDYDSTSSFEFHKGERSLHHSMTRSFSRPPMSSKWNDAEKWIMNRQNTHSNNSKRSNLHNQGNRVLAANTIRGVPDSSTSLENKPSVKRVDFCQPATHMGSSKLGYASNGTNALLHDCPESKDLMEVEDDRGLPRTKSAMDDSSGVPGIRSVSMRDMGTEMTPIPSEEPSRSTTPVSATTPLRSPTSSMPSTPRRGGDPHPTTPTDSSVIPDSSQHHQTKQELSEQDLKVKTRREIVALGVQLGKMNIAAWASSKDEKDKGHSGNKNVDRDELVHVEYAERALAWEEAEKSKHGSRFKREEIRIEAWESQQKAKLEAEMRKIEAQIEQMRAHAQAKMVKKIALARQKSEEKRAAAEARKTRQAEKTAQEVEYIRQTGRIPSSSPFVCCGW